MYKLKEKKLIGLKSNELIFGPSIYIDTLFILVQKATICGFFVSRTLIKFEDC